MMQSLSRWVALFGGFCLLGLMLLSVVSVFMRKVVGAPMLGALDLTQMGLVVVVFSSLAYCGVMGSHVAVEIIDTILSRLQLKRLKTGVSIVTAIFVAFLSYQMALKGLSAIRFNEATMLTQIPFAPFIFFAAGGLALFAAAMASVALNESSNGQANEIELSQ